MIARSVLLQLANSKQVESFVRKNAWSSRLASRFVAGETVEDVIAPVRTLNAQEMATSLDFLGESVTNEQEVAVTTDTYLRLFQAIRDCNLNSAASVKLTALGLDIDAELCFRNMERLLNAAEPGVFVQIDMEGSDYTERTLALFHRLWATHKNVGAVVQAYLYRTEEDVEQLIETGARVRLCKGAYKEPPEVAFPAKSEVDENYIHLMQRLLERGNYPGIATHDERIIEETKRFAREAGVAPDRFEFQMLYGVRRDLQTRLVEEGYHLTIYTPFGTHWYPYMMRRLAERPANLWFVLKNMMRP